MNVPDVIKALLEVTGWSQRKLADRLGVNQPDVSRWLNGGEPRGQNMEAIRDLAIQQGALPSPERHTIPIMGYVGAGGDIDPDYEQVPFDGLEQIELPGAFAVLGDLVGYIVRGESMMPRYNDGDVVLVSRDPYDTGFETLVGDEAVLTTHDGRRFLKRIMPSERRGIYKLVSVNADAVFVNIRSASPVRVIIPQWADSGKRRAIEKRPTRSAAKPERAKRAS